MEIETFNEKLNKWFLDTEWTEVYRINHPNKNHNEVHFIKNLVRVCCVKHFKDEYFYLNTQAFLEKEKEILTLKTGKEFIFDNKGEYRTDKRDSLLNLLAKKRKEIERKSKKNRLLYFFVNLYYNLKDKI